MSVLPLLVLSAFATGLSKNSINATIRKNNPEAIACYKQGLSRNPALKGKLIAAFTVAPDGKVKEATISKNELGDEKVAECLAEKIKGWKFPESLEGEESIVAAYPFVFNPAK